MENFRNELDLKQSNRELHDLCQPLTALQCRLELGKMLGHPEAFEEAVNGSLEETLRIFEIISNMRHRLMEIEASAHE